MVTSTTATTVVPFLIPGSRQRSGTADKNLLALPKVLGGGQRSAGSPVRDVFINESVIKVEQVFDLSGTGRSAAGAQPTEVGRSQVLVLEATDGSSLIVRADKLQADLQRLYPTATGAAVDLGVLRDNEAAARGLGSWIWSKLSVLNLVEDGLVAAARDKALELLKDKLGSRIEDLAYANASWAGAKALMWAIESKLEGEPGLYRWQEPQLQAADRVGADDPGLQDAVKKESPLLIFIHGTASCSVGSFGGLRSGDDEARWDNLIRRFGKHVYAFEHRTLSESPLDNALQLARTLPAGAKFSLVTHSRGGLVGDLLCLGEFDDTLIQRYQRLPIEKDGAKESDDNRRLREQVVAAEHAQLRELRQLLEEKQFRIERYVRVACPAAGTTLLADNLDLFLSGLLSLMTFAAGLLPGVGAVGGSVLSALRRVVLEMAEKRIDPRLVPGLEAMLPQSPLTALLGQAPCRDGVQMAVIAGNAEGDGGHLLKRIAVMLTDWIIFGKLENDFVVDTQSMRAGLARRKTAYEYYAHGHQVSHIHYFQRLDTRHALWQWLVSAKPQELPAFSRIPTDCDIKLDVIQGVSRASRSQPLPANAPIVFYLPGIMGTHLEIRKAGQGVGEGDRVWFDPFHLAAGGIDQMNINKSNVMSECLFQRYYGDLQTYLEQSHELIPFPYDWRKPITETAQQFAQVVQAKLDELERLGQPHRPVSILAHSMGGLVVRTLIAQQAALWDRLALRPNSYFVMLGTPNHGSHQIVENLLGKGNSVRQLAMVDFQHDLQEILNIMADFDGVLNLLPPDGFVDTGVQDALAQDAAHKPVKYFEAKMWNALVEKNQDRWLAIRSGLGARPGKERLQAAKAWWELLSAQETTFPHAERVRYVFGVDGHTPAGLTVKGNALHLHGTVQGDGSVSWASGRLSSLPDGQHWYMPVSHSDLTCTPTYFPAIAELLDVGKTATLEQKPPRTRSSLSRSYPYDAGPALQPGAEDLALSFFGGRPNRQPVADTTQTLQVSVQAMDLRFAQHPILCGHYQGDAIAGAERQIDQCLLGGALSQRERLGVYAGMIGTSTVVLAHRSAEDKRRDTGKGAIIVGLGDWNQINAQRITETVRDGVLEYLLNTSGQSTPATAASAAQEELLTINSLLIGYNSTTHISVEASIGAIVRGVCEANQQYRYNPLKGQPLRSIRRLEFIEFYLDTAITAAHAVRDLPQRLDKELERLEARIIPDTELNAPCNKGVRHRLSERFSMGGYWPRLMITDAASSDEQCPAECYQDQVASPLPKVVLDSLKRQWGVKDELIAEEEVQQHPAERLKYVYLSERARAEAVLHQRQPGLVEALIKDAIRDSRENAAINRTLFQLMVPLDFKSAARQTNRLLLVLDGYTANLPWEMLQADDEPLALKMAMVRQLVSTRYRRKVSASLGRNACVIGNPATDNFYRHFPSYDPAPDSGGNKSLPSLPAAATEARAVMQVLQNANYDVTSCFPATEEESPSKTALDVLNVLFQKPYRILMIAAHGEVNIRGRDGKRRTGVVLSDGVMLTAAEVGQMEEVPDLVFLNCCHLAKVDGHSSSNRLAYSLSRELIEMGVRCVVAAGWAVDDAAACTFSTTFFELFVGNNQPFGQAVWEARKKTRAQHQGINTWGAYQAYGDPSYVLDSSLEYGVRHAGRVPVSPHELYDYLESLYVNMHHKVYEYTFESLQAELEPMLGRIPHDWVCEPGVQYQLSRLYGNTLPDGFEHARQACQVAIAEEDRNGSVPITALEQLANLEARQAAALAEQAFGLPVPDEAARKQQCLEEAQQLVEMAIQRLEGLIQITQQTQLATTYDAGQGSITNTERYALLGSAYKRQALIRLYSGAAWDGADGKPEGCIREALLKSREAYLKGEGLSFGYNFKPYAVINRLQLDGLLQIGSDAHEYTPLVEKAQIAARQRFKESYDFFDAVMSADAELARFLLQGGVCSPSAQDDLECSFRDAIGDVPSTAREMDSMLGQIEHLGRLLEKRAVDLDDQEAKARVAILRALAARLRPAG